jgi:hypothetical protein
MINDGAWHITVCSAVPLLLNDKGGRLTHGLKIDVFVRPARSLLALLYVEARKVARSLPIECLDVQLRAVRCLPLHEHVCERGSYLRYTVQYMGTPKLCTRLSTKTLTYIRA